MEQNKTLVVCFYNGLKKNLFYMVFMLIMILILSETVIVVQRQTIVILFYILAASIRFRTEPLYIQYMHRQVFTQN